MEVHYFLHLAHVRPAEHGLEPFSPELRVLLRNHQGPVGFVDLGELVVELLVGGPAGLPGLPRFTLQLMYCPRVRGAFQPEVVVPQGGHFVRVLVRVVAHEVGSRVQEGSLEPSLLVLDALGAVVPQVGGRHVVLPVHGRAVVLPVLMGAQLVRPDAGEP